jgi:hypothetical protein
MTEIPRGAVTRRIMNTILQRKPPPVQALHSPSQKINLLPVKQHEQVVSVRPQPRLDFRLPAQGERLPRAIEGHAHRASQEAQRAGKVDEAVEELREARVVASRPDRTDELIACLEARRPYPPDYKGRGSRWRATGWSRGTTGRCRVGTRVGG